MANDTVTQAAFTEVLELGVDTAGFAKQMDQVADIYAAAIEKMPSLDKVAGVAFSDSIVKLNQTIDSLAKNSGEALGELAASMADTSSVIAASMAKSAAAVEAGQQKIVDALTKVKTAQNETKASSEGMAGFFQGLTEQFAKSAGAILKYTLVYKSIGAVLEGTVAAISAPFKAVAEGFTYLQDIQERSSQVKAALLQSVSFSSDWGENVKIAGQQADILVHKVDDFAAKLKVSSQSVQTGLTAFLEYGGRNLTQNLDQAVQVSALVTGALQTQSPNLDSRKLIGEIQKLVQGAAGDTDKLAAALGLSKDQLKEMVAHAQKYHDLYDEILARSPGIAQRIGEANDKQVTLLATLELYKDRWEGLIAGPLFDKLTSILQSVLAWVDKNGDALQNIGVNLGKALGNAADSAQRFLTGNWDGLKNDLLIIGSTFLLIGTAIASIANTTISMMAEAAAFGDKTANSMSAGNRADFASIEGGLSHVLPENYGGSFLRGQAQKDRSGIQGDIDASKSAADREHQTALAEKNVDKILDKLTVSLMKLSTGDTSGLSFLTQSTAPKNTAEAPNVAKDNLHPKSTGDLSTLRAAQQELRDEITKTKNAYSDLRDTVQDSLTKSTINHKQAAVDNNLLYAAEIADVEELIKAYQKKAQASGAKPEQIKSAVAAMQNELDVLKGQASKAVNAGQRAADAEDLAAQKVHLQEVYQLQVQHQKDLLALSKQNQQDGVITQTQGFDQETSIIKAEYALQRQTLVDAVNQYADGTVKKQEALKQLDLAEAQYNAQYALRSQQRVDVVRAEQQATFQHEQNQRQSGLDTQTIVDNSSDIVSASERNAKATQELNLQKQITQAAIDNTTALLNEAKAKNENSQATQALQDKLAGLHNTQLQQSVSAIRLAGQSQGSNVALAQSAEKNAADAEIAKVKQQAANLVEALKKASDAGDAQAVKDLTSQLAETGKSLHSLQTIADTLGTSLSKAGQVAENEFLGPDFKSQMQQGLSDWSKADDGIEKLSAGTEVAAAGLSGLTNLANNIMGTINQYEQGRKQGGVIGGIGSVLSSGPISDALSAIPVVGSIVKPLGAAFSFIGDMFVAQAKKIADSINKNIDAINKSYSLGQTTLSQTIADLQKQRDSAVAQLSGVKGGKDQLNKLLPEIDDEMAQLQKQADDLKKSFEDQLSVLQSGGTVLQNWTKSWMDINQQVKDYLDAGGDLSKANQFLNDELAEQSKSLIDSMAQGEQQAIQDALSLNDLIKQRIELQKEEAAAEFGITNYNAIERRTSVGVQVASQLSQQKSQYADQLQSLNDQINLTQQKVTLESQVFSIASDTASLQAQSDALSLASLQDQLEQYKEMQQIIQNIAGLQFGGAFNSGYTPGLSGSGASASPIVLTVNVDAGGQDVNSKQFASYLADAITSQVSSNRTNI
jgi:hypothetical protein